MKKLLLFFFFTGTIIMIVIMAKTGAPLKTPATPKGILDLEFAYNIEKTKVVINAWQPTPAETCGRKTEAIFNTYLDFIFIFFYSGFLFLACRRIAQNKRDMFSKAGNMIATGAIIAGILDILENIGMLISLSGNISGTVSFLTTFFSVIKWVLALVAVLYVMMGSIILGWRKVKN